MNGVSPLNNGLTIQSISTTPFKEGGARIMRSVESVDLSQAKQPSRPLLDRLIYLLIGLALIIPVINVIIWTFMHHVGKAEALSPKDDMAVVPWSAAAKEAKRPPAEIAAPFVVSDDIALREPETYKTLNQENNGPEYKTAVTIEYTATGIVVKNVSPARYMESIYDPQWQLQSIILKDTNRKVDITLTKEGNTIRLTGTKNGESLDKVYENLDSNMVWIQPYSQAIRPFAMDPHKDEIECYGISPKDLTLGFGVLKKTTMLDHENCVSIELRPKAAAARFMFGAVSTTLHNSITGAQLEETWQVKPFGVTWYTATSKVLDNS